MRLLAPQELLLLKSWAREEFLKIVPSDQLKDSGKPLSHGDMLALAYFNATVRLVAHLKIDPLTIQVHYDSPSSSPETSDEDWIFESL